MNDREQQIAEIVKSALEYDPAEWPDFLDAACASDATVRDEVESLLQFQPEASQFIEQGALRVAAQAMAQESAAPLFQSVEGYEIRSRIGVGGMGDVYLAQDTKLKRRVALKLVRSGMDSADLVSRFRREEQILASLNHPNIAQLYGAGVAAGDIPFFAMEYIEGLRIDQYCETNALSLATRLQLFRKVCAAVHYAHQRLVIHRDLKPSNILVTADGEPKLLDFGIAKLIEGQEAFTQLETFAGVMTPDYASPEQVRGETMTTATDVYSLGVLLYEILTGQRPYRLKTRSPDEIARAITDQQPEPPSTTVSRSSPSSFVIRHSSFPKGDLDNIVLMALRKEPQRRYASVGQFSEDLRRYLEGLPVLAHKDTVPYRTTKFIKRNKIAVAAASIIVLTLLGGIIATGWQARRATEQARAAAQERDRARVAAAKAERINEFLQHILRFSQADSRSSNPQKKTDATIVEALDEATRRAERELVDQPEILAAVQFSLSQSYAGLGKSDLAVQHLRASWENRRRVLGPEHLDTAQSITALAEQLVNQGKYAEAESLAREAVAVYRRGRERGDVDPRWFSISLNCLGISLISKGDAPAGEAALLEAVEVGANLTGEDRGMLANIYGNLGISRGNQGDIDGAVAYLQKSVEEARRLPGEASVNLAITIGNLGSFLTIKGDYARAEPPLRESLDIFRKTVGEKHQFPAWSINFLADNYCEQGDYPRALEEANRALAIQREVLEEGHIDFARSWTVLGKILTRTGELAKGEEHLRNALALRLKALKSGHWRLAETQGALGECLTAQQRMEEAETLLLESHNSLKKSLGGKDPRTRDAQQRLVRLYESWGKPEQAAAYRG